jgi:hypothetical protein
MKYKIYLASPYSKQSDLFVAYEKTKAVTELCIDAGFYVFSPIVYCHHMNRLGTTYTFWEGFCKSLIMWSDIFIVHQLDGWEDSVGVSDEMLFCNDISKPIGFLSDNDYEVPIRQRLDIIIRTILGLQ